MQKLNQWNDDETPWYERPQFQYVPPNIFLNKFNTNDEIVFYDPWDNYQPHGQDQRQNQHQYQQYQVHDQHGHHHHDQQHPHHNDNENFGRNPVDNIVDIVHTACTQQFGIKQDEITKTIEVASNIVVQNVNSMTGPRVDNENISQNAFNALENSSSNNSPIILSSSYHSSDNNNLNNNKNNISNINNSDDSQTNPNPSYIAESVNNQAEVGSFLFI